MVESVHLREETIVNTCTTAAETIQVITFMHEAQLLPHSASNAVCESLYPQYTVTSGNTDFRGDRWVSLQHRHRH